MNKQAVSLSSLLLNSCLFVYFCLFVCLFVVSLGAQDDLDKVTKMAYRQVVEYGMSPKIGHISLPIKGSRDFSRTLYSDKLCRMIDEVS